MPDYEIGMQISGMTGGNTNLEKEFLGVGVFGVAIVGGIAI